MKLLKYIKDMSVLLMLKYKNRKTELLLRKDGFILYFYLEGKFNISFQLVIYQLEFNCP